MDYIAMLQETLQIMEQGSYEKNDRTVRLKLSRQQMEEAKVLLPQEVDGIKNFEGLRRRCPSGGRQLQ